jgi:hypothetical protein
VEDIYLDGIPTNFLCQTIGKLADKKIDLTTRLEVDRYQLTIIITIPSQFEKRGCGYFYHHTELTLDFTFLLT